jgi:hypothetical protein
VKKYYPLLTLVAIAWVFSSCGGSDNPTPTESIVTSPNVQPSNTPTASPTTTPTSSSSSQPTPEASPSATASTSEPSSALVVAQGLTVRGRAADTNYSRDAFGSAWKDVDRNGCDTRNDILKRDFTTSVFKAGTGDCKVIGGTWTDPYSNESYTFNEAPSGAQIDHMVALKNAWQMGADLWNDQMRVEFANDPLNLRVTIASLNQQKSDSNAASWLPPYKPGRCDFIATQVAVKAKWELYVTSSEKQVFIDILSKPECAKTVLPK